MLQKWSLAPLLSTLPSPKSCCPCSCSGQTAFELPLDHRILYSGCCHESKWLKLHFNKPDYKLQCFRKGLTVHSMWSEISKRGARHKATNTKLLCLPQFNLLLNACQSLQWNTMENIKKKRKKDEETIHTNKVHTVPWDSQKLTYKVLSFTRITSLFPAPWIT